jgi:tetratricopeptide (TPR) repeat protein
MATDIRDEPKASIPTIAEAMWEIAADAARFALRAANDGTTDQDAAYDVVIRTVERLKEAGAPESIWQGLIDDALLTVRPDDRRTRARLLLLLPPAVEPVSVPLGAVAAETWIGYDPDVLEAARATDSEDDFARTLFVHSWLSPDELEALLARARAWKSNDARTRAMTVVAESHLYRFGDFARAEALLRELYEGALERDSPAHEAKALVRLALAQFALGLLDEARLSVSRAKAAVAKLGPGAIVPEHPGDTARDIYPEPSMQANFACFFDGDWHAIAEHWARVASLPERRGVAIVEVGMAAFAHARAGEAAEAILLLDLLTETLETLAPRTWAANGAVGRAARAVWYLRLHEFASAYRRFALELIDAGVGNWPTVSNAHTVACMAALGGDLAEAAVYFDRARDELVPGAHRPQRAIIDYDEALALHWFGSPNDDPTIGELLTSALETFRGLNMTGWERRALAQLVLRGRGVYGLPDDTAAPAQPGADE